VHGEAALAAAEQVSTFFFGGLDPRELTPEAFDILRAEAPFVEVGAAAVTADGDASKLDVLKLLTASALAASNGAAKRLLEQGGVSVNKRKVGSADRLIDSSVALLAGGYVVVGKGKRDVAVVRVR
jgi:tyrosyl-tRNA synthetase